ncbi:MAG: hypothetical protein DRO11_05160, partial [Methanobacteriota archaeon]
VLLATILSDLEKVDTAKVARMALIHDLAESVLGDMPQQATSIVGRKEKEFFEGVAVKKVFEKLPEEIRGLYWSTWEEFVDGKSREAKLVRKADWLERSIQALEYMEQGYKGLEEYLEEENRNKGEVTFETVEKLGGSVRKALSLLKRVNR